MTRGQRIKAKREELNIPQTDFAKRVNISKQTLYKYENDIVTNIPYDKVVEMANALGVTPAYIFGWEGPSAEERLLNAYINNAQDQEFLDLYHKADPVIRQAVLNFLRNAPHDS